MQDHISETIASIDRKLTELQTVRTSLVVLFGAAEPARVIAAPVTAVPVKPARVNAVTRKSPPKANTLPRAGSAERNLAAAAKLSVPFTGGDFAKAVGLTKNGAHSQLNRWIGRGLLARVGFGKFERTAKFPSKETKSNNPKPAPEPVVLADRSRLERQLGDALRQRDAARTAGRDSLVDMFQADVDSLEGQIAAL